MNVSPTLTADEFKTIHNAVCDLDNLVDRLEEVLRPELYSKLKLARDNIRHGLVGAYKQDHIAYERKSNHYEAVGRSFGLRSTWSLHEVDDLLDRHRFEGAVRVVYRDHWGPHTVESRITGSTWADLWQSADVCIRDSGDNHHIFVENFSVDKNDSSVLILSTGS